MTSPNAFEPSTTVSFVLRNNSSLRRSLKVFNHSIPYGGTQDLMKIPGITEEDIRTEVLRGTLKAKLASGSFQVVSSTVNFQTSDSLQGGFLKSVGINPTGSSGSVASDPLTQLNWYVHPTTGSDSNDGSTSGTALKTVAELSRRWGKGNLISPAGANGGGAVTVTVNLLAAVPSTDPLNIDVILDGNVRLVFQGGVTTSTPLTVSAVTQRNRATNTPWQFTATGGVTVANRIYDSTAGAYFWAVKDQGANSFRLTEPCTKPSLGSLLADGNQVAILQTDTFVMQTLFTLKLGSVKVQSVRNTSAGPPFPASLILRDLDLTGDYNPDLSSNASGYVYECKFTKAVTPATGSFFNLQNCCQPTGQVVRPTGGLTRFGAGGYIGSGTGFSPTTAGLQFSNDVIFQSNSISIVGSNVLAILGGCGIFDGVAGGNGGSNPSGNALHVGVGCQVTLRTSIVNALWGSGSDGYGVGVQAGAAFLYVNDAAVPTLTGTKGDFSLAQTVTSYGTDATGAYVGPTANTWANLLTAIGAGTGFGGNAHNPQKKASILKIE